MGWLLRSLGNAGSQAGEGFDIAQQWRQRAQQMKFDAARQKIADLMAPLQLSELRTKLKQAGLPQYEGTAPTEGGGESAIMYDPSAGSVTTQPLSGVSAKQGYADIKIGKDGNPYGLNQRTGKYEAIPTPPGADFVVPGAATSGRLMRGDIVPDRNSSTGYSRLMMDQQGNVVKTVPNIVVPGLTARESEGFAITTDEDGNVIMVPKTTVTRPAGTGAAPSSGGTPVPGGQDGSRVIGHRDTAIQKDAVKSSQQARDAYTNYLDAVNNARTNNPRTNVALVIAAAKSTIAGGGGRLNSAEIEQQLKAGSFPDKVERWYQMATSGTLPTDQRQQILDLVKNDYTAKRQSAEDAWKYAYPGKPLPPWIKGQNQQQDQKQGQGQANSPAPPPGYVLDSP